MTRTEATQIISLLEAGYSYKSTLIGQLEWGLEYHVPDVLMWSTLEGRDRSEKIMGVDETVLMLMQYHFGQIRRRMRHVV